MPGRRQSHLLPGLRRAGERNMIYAGMRRQGGARFDAQACADIQRSGGQAGFHGDLGHFQQRQAGILGRLDHAGIAGGQRGPDAAPENLQRIVPGNDVASYAMRLAHGQDGVVAGIGNGRTVQLVDRAGVELEIARHSSGVRASLAQRLACVFGLDLGQCLVLILQGSADTQEQPAALGRRHFAPGALKGGACGPDGHIDVGFARTGNLREKPAIGRIYHRHGLSRQCAYPLIGDKVLVHHGMCPVVVGQSTVRRSI
jgi:hypothetical protein